MKRIRLTAVILSVVMLLCAFNFGAFAQEEKLSYLVLGDSIGYGSGLRNSKEACYGKIVADTNGYDYANDAIPGHTTQNLLSRLEEKEVASHVKQADIISISIGGNNFLLGNMAGLLFDVMVKGDDSAARATVDNFYKDFDKIIKKIKSLNPDAVILMQTLYNPQTGYIGEAYQVSIDILNEAILRYAQENEGAIETVDVASILKDSGKDFAADGIHPSVQGNEKIAAAVLEKLVELGLGKTAVPVITVKGEDVVMPPVFTLPLKFYGTLLHIISLFYGIFA